MKDITNIDKDKAIIVEVEYNGQKYVEYIETFKLSEEFTPSEVRDALNLIPSRFAYWSSLYTDIAADLRLKQEAMTFWTAKKIALVRKEYPKLTSDRGREQQALIDHPDEYKKRLKGVLVLETTKGKVKAIIGALEIQSRTLQTIASSLRSEMEMTS